MNIRNIQEAIMAKKQEVVEESVYYKTGCTLMDLAVGGSKGVFGFQGGKWVNLVGDASAGKSLLCLETIIASKYKYKDDLKVFYDDTENGFTFDVEGRYGAIGLEMKPEGTVDSETVEEMSCQFTNFLNSIGKGEKGIYTVDSLDGLADNAAIEMDTDRQKAFDKGQEFDKQSYQMGLQKFLSQQYFKNKHGLLDDKNALCIITSQVRQNVGGGLYGPKFVRAGGKAMDLYANYIIWLKTLQHIEKNGTKIGAVVHAKVTKAKVARPYREIIYTVMFDYGIDDIASNLDYLYDLRSAKTGELLKKADKIVWDDEDPVDHDAMIAYIEDNHLQKELKARTIAKWEEHEASIASNRPSKYEGDDDE
jgi:RecA/RadA recombinase